MITLPEIIQRDKRPPSVTVSMSCYNHAKYLDEALHSILMQKTNFPVNIVIHDDASTDGSAEIIKRYAAENPNITAILQPENLYQNGKFSLPFLLPHYTGKYIAYCECDDFWIDEHKLQMQVNYMENNPDCMAVCSNTLPVNKFSRYDESCRAIYNPKTGEGNYPSWYVFGIRHQLASYVMRNFWQFMTPDDINMYMNVKANGDEKLLNFCIRLGRVHYFKKELAAYRRVVDEGDSYSARMRRSSKYQIWKNTITHNKELRRMLLHFFGDKHKFAYDSVYNLQLLFYEVMGRVIYRKSITRDLDMKGCMRNIPWYIYIAFPFFFPCYLGYKVFKAGRKNIINFLLSPKKA